MTSAWRTPPRRPARPCMQGGCPALVRDGSKCEAHRRRDPDINRRHDATRASSSQRGYDGQWSKVRRMVLAAEPLCRHCDETGSVTPATMVDHVIPLNQGGARLDRANLQPLCDPCHAAKTARDGSRGPGRAGLPRRG